MDWGLFDTPPWKSVCNILGMIQPREMHSVDNNWIESVKLSFSGNKDICSIKRIQEGNTLKAPKGQYGSVTEMRSHFIIDVTSLVAGILTHVSKTHNTDVVGKLVDPSASIDIHFHPQLVLEWGPDLKNGTVLLLKKISVFVTGRAPGVTLALNAHPRNLVALFPRAAPVLRPPAALAAPHPSGGGAAAPAPVPPGAPRPEPVPDAATPTSAAPGRPVGGVPSAVLPGRASPSRRRGGGLGGGRGVSTPGLKATVAVVTPGTGLSGDGFGREREMGNRDVQQRSIPLRFDRNEEPMELQKGEDIRALVTPSTGLPVMPSQHSQDHKKMAALFTKNRVERIDKETPNSTSQNSIWGGGLSASCTTIDGLDLEDGDFLSEGDLNPSGESNDDEYNLPQQQQKRGLETGVSSPMKKISKRRRNNINIGAVEVRSKKNTEELVSTGEDCSACDDDDDDTNNHGPKIGDELMGHDKELCSTASNSSTTTKKQSQQLSSIFSKEATSGGNLSSVLDAMIFSQDDSDDAFC